MASYKLSCMSLIMFDNVKPFYQHVSGSIVLLVEPEKLKVSRWVAEDTNTFVDVSRITFCLQISFWFVIMAYHSFFKL